GCAADVVAVARRAEGHHPAAVEFADLLGFEWFDHAGGLRHPADPLVGLDRHVFCTTIVGNLSDMSRAFSAILTATLRAIMRYLSARSPSGSATTVGRPESACCRMRMSRGSPPR